MPKTFIKDTTLVQTRIPTKTKQKVEIMLESIGLSINDFVRVSIQNFANNGSINLQANSSKVLTQEDFSPEAWQKIIEAQEEIKNGDIAFRYSPSRDGEFASFYEKQNTKFKSKSN
jgi:antitoxin component of RelBE/YafQ-DinJ toxin-antitoxin module